MRVNAHVINAEPRWLDPLSLKALIWSCYDRRGCFLNLRPYQLKVARVWAEGFGLRTSGLSV